MDKLKISTAQFEHRSGDKAYNLSVIEKLSQKASADGADIIAFHECSITGYTFARDLSKEQMLEVARVYTKWKQPINPDQNRPEKQHHCTGRTF